MELLRQAGTIHEGEGIDLDMRIAAALDGGDTHRDRLVAALNVSPQLLDARLFWMHCHAQLRLCVFRLIVTTDFGIVTGHFGDRDRQ